MAFAGNLNIHLGFPMCQPRSSSQGFLPKALKERIKVLGPWCWLFLVWPFPRSGTLQLVSLESLWPSSLLLHVLYVDQDPLVPTLGTKPEDTTRPFHFSLPLDFDRTSNESFLLSRIPVSGLFYLLGRPRHSLDLLSRPLPFKDLLGFPSKDLLPGDLACGPSLGPLLFLLFLSFLFFLGLHGPS